MEQSRSTVPAERHARPFVSGIILAAGTSMRMGQPKQLLPLHDRPLLQHVVDAAVASCLDEIILVLGHRAAEIRAAVELPQRVHVAVNVDYAQGQSTSLRVGIGAASPLAIAAAILLGDQPGVTAQLIEQVAAAFQTSNARIVRPVYTGPDGRRLPGHPVFLAREIWRDVEALRGDRGARGLLEAHPEWLFEVPVAGEAPRDVDTWAEYQQMVEASLAQPAGRRAT